MGVAVGGAGRAIITAAAAMVGVEVEKLIDARIWIGRRAARVMGAGDAVPEMSVGGVDKEQFAMLVPIVAPGIGRAVADHFDNLTHGMIAPDCAAQRRPLL